MDFIGIALSDLIRRKPELYKKSVPIDADNRAPVIIIPNHAVEIF